MPSIMRAPPEHETMMIGSRSASARSIARVIFSPTTAPMLPPMKAYSMDAMIVRIPSSRPVAMMTASFTPVEAMLACRRLA
jgi:hypothetical protein